MRESRVLAHADELRVRTEPEPSCTEDVVAHGELVDGSADGFDHSRQLAAEDPPPRSTDTKDDTADQRDRQTAASVGFTCGAIQSVDRRGVNPDENLVLFWDGPIHFFEAQDVGRTVPVIDNSSHEIFLRRPVLPVDDSAEAEWWILIGHQHKGVAAYPVAPAEYAYDEVKETPRVRAREENGKPGDDYRYHGSYS